MEVPDALSLHTFGTEFAQTLSVLLPCVLQLHALKDDLELLDSSLRVEACSGQQRTSVMASKILADLVQAVMAGLELLAKAASATSEAAKPLTDPLELLGRPLLFLVSTAAAARKRPRAVPSGVLPGRSLVRRSRLQSGLRVACEHFAATLVCQFQHARQHVDLYFDKEKLLCAQLLLCDMHPRVMPPVHGSHTLMQTWLTCFGMGLKFSAYCGLLQISCHHGEQQQLQPLHTCSSTARCCHPQAQHEVC